MAREHPAEIFMPPNVLKAKAGKGMGLDRATLARATAVLTEIRTELAQGLEREIEALLLAGKDVEHAPASPDKRGALRAAAAALAKAARLSDFPLVARLAASLGQWTALDPAGDPAGAIKLLRAHTDAIRAVMKDTTRNPNDRLAHILVETLEARVAEAAAA
ncbi:MAG: hypothetical protein GC199_03425 [Alphaproteobacteria bacterium]|nr:hypothetical protein [Alphaproteobacteria bacterium]